MHKLAALFVIAIGIFAVFTLSHNSANTVFAEMQSGTLDNLKITIVVDKVQAHDHGSSCIDDWGGGCGWADFYPEAYINDVGPDDINGTSLGGKSYEIGDEDKIHPGSNWPLFRAQKYLPLMDLLPG